MEAPIMKQPIPELTKEHLVGQDLNKIIVSEEKVIQLDFGYRIGSTVIIEGTEYLYEPFFSEIKEEMSKVLFSIRWRKHIRNQIKSRTIDGKSHDEYFSNKKPLKNHLQFLVRRSAFINNLSPGTLLTEPKIKELVDMFGLDLTKVREIKKYPRQTNNPYSLYFED